MIKIQHWKIYAAQYNDESSGIGMELKKIQLAYRHYEGLGVPISGELLTRSRKCNLDGVYPYLYDGTSNNDYKLAVEVDRSNCSVTVSEFFSTKQNTKHNTIDTMEKDFALENCFKCNDTVGDADLVAFSTPQNAKQMSSLQRDLSGENEDQTKLFTCEFSSNDGEIVTMHTPQQSKQISLGNEHVCMETEMRQCQENTLFLSPTTKKLHNSIEKASKSTQTLYTTNSLREARKNIIASVDHILQHDFVREIPIAAEFVSTLEKEVQNIKEDFNKKIMSIMGTKIGKDNELCFLSFKNKKQKVIDKRFKGYGG
jgi:hypothetical protein